MIDWPLERDLARTVAAAQRTRERIASHVRHTPLVELEGNPRRLLKLESSQHTGSFKIRGAAAAITAQASPRRIVAASTGNHGLAVASLARQLALPCRVFVAAGAASVKLELLRASGAEIVEVDGDPLHAELAAREAAENAGALLVPPYNDPHVILGQATLGLELLDDLDRAPDLAFIAAGGGGLIGGVALAVRERWPDCRIVACLPAASPALADAVAAGHVVASRLGPTLADATAGNIEEGSITVPIAAALVDEFELFSEEEIAAAMRVARLEYRLAIEGAAALALAGSLRRPPAAAPQSHLVVLGGSNGAAPVPRART